jgi:hypothetical protein
MNEKRIEKAEAATRARLEAEWYAALEPLKQILFSAPDEEFQAYMRQGKAEGVCQDVDILDPQPGDAELLARLDARIPLELLAHLEAAAAAAHAVGLK